MKCCNLHGSETIRRSKQSLRTDLRSIMSHEKGHQMSNDGDTLAVVLWNLSRDTHVMSILMLNCCKTLYLYQKSAVVCTESGGRWSLPPFMCWPPARSHSPASDNGSGFWAYRGFYSLLKTSVLTQRKIVTVPWRNESSSFYQASVNLTFFSCRNKVSHSSPHIY